MLEWLENIDKKLLLLINGFHNSFLDTIMYAISHKFFWIPFYVFLLYLIIKRFKKQSWLIVIAIGILIALSDQISVKLFKNIFLRYRPCHNLDLKSMIHLVHGHCGGMYGFVSSHAANAFALAAFVSLLFKSNKIVVYSVFSYATLVGFSRVYLGVHYPADIAVGGLLGICIAIFIFGITKIVLRKVSKFYI